MSKGDLSPRKRSDSFSPFAREALINEVQDIVASEELNNSLSAFQNGQESFSQELKRFESTIKQTALIAAFVIWIDTKNFNDLMREEALKLIKLNLIRFKDTDGSLINLSKINANAVSEQINSIRCQTHIEISQRESFVSVLLDFYRWLSLNTHSLVSRGKDPDLHYIEKRNLDLSDFLLILKGLDDRSRLIAKLLYYGGSRVLEEVVNLQIENVNFIDQIILYGEIHTEYPPHVFQDIKTLIKDRKSGPVFTGRNNSKMNPSTIFRHFQALGTIRGLENISPKTLTEDRQQGSAISLQ